jgi:hypothetical protein
LIPYISDVLGVEVWASTMPEHANRPALVFSVIASERWAGTIWKPSDYVRWRYQFDSYSDDSKQAKTLSESLRLAIEQYKGFMGSTTDGQLYIKSIRLQDRKSSFGTIESGGDAGLFRYMSEYVIVSREPVVSRG